MYLLPSETAVLELLDQSKDEGCDVAIQIKNYSINFIFSD